MLSPSHQDIAGAWLVEPRETIEQGGLAGAIRPDQAENLALMHVEGDAIERDDAAEHDADVADRKQGVLSLRELCLRHLVPPKSLVGGGMTPRNRSPVIVTEAT